MKEALLKRASQYGSPYELFVRPEKPIDEEFEKLRGMGLVAYCSCPGNSLEQAMNIMAIDANNLIPIIVPYDANQVGLKSAENLDSTLMKIQVVRLTNQIGELAAGEMIIQLHFGGSDIKVEKITPAIKKKNLKTFIEDALLFIELLPKSHNYLIATYTNLGLAKILGRCGFKKEELLKEDPRSLKGRGEDPHLIIGTTEELINSIGEIEKYGKIFARFG